MNKIKYSLSGKALAKIYTVLNSNESKNESTLEKSKVTISFLLDNLEYDDHQDSKEIRTKRRVLHIRGDFARDPATLKDSRKLKTHLHFQQAEFNRLRIDLDVLIKEYKLTAKLTQKEVNDCETVGACVKLVLDKT